MGLRVAELFAGVGGFRRGLRAAQHQVVWFNQWEPLSKRRQYAYECYVRNFHADFVGPINPVHNTDIAQVHASRIPDHDLLVGGFPCQDYSVASPLRHSKGLRGRKGVLWWEITRIVEEKRPPYLLLENVDRLLSSPKKRRGRDFAVVLACLSKLGYAVEWRIINAAHYGEPQKRRRVFIFAARLESDAGRRIMADASRADYLTAKGFFAKEFPVVQEPVPPLQRQKSDWTLDEPHIVSRKRRFVHFHNAGVMVRRKVWTQAVRPRAEPSGPTLRSVVRRRAPREYYLSQSDIQKYRVAKGRKDLMKSARGGYQYRYNEGSIPFPDPLNQPSRTILTGEGGRTPNRTNHVIEDPFKRKGNRLRVLTPEECEQLMGFRVGHTKNLPRRWRYFVLGNAVVVGIVRRIGTRITEFIEESTAPVVHKDAEPKITA